MKAIEGWVCASLVQDTLIAISFHIEEQLILEDKTGLS